MSADCCGPLPQDNGTSGPSPAETGPEEDANPPWWRDREVLLPVISGVAWALGTVLDITGAVGDATVDVLFAVALVAGAITFVPGTLDRLRRGRGRDRLGVGLLMTIAAVGATALGHLGEAAALAFLFSVSEMLEDRAMDRAKGKLRALLALIPESARILRACGDLVTVPAADLRCGDVLVVGAGERIATDGVIVEGSSGVDTSAVTGESIPVVLGCGDTVYAGSVNGTATLRIEATADGRDNSLTRIVGLVEQAQARKGVRARLADRIAQPLVPAVLVVSLAVALIGVVVGDPAVWIDRALVVLVAASPCALAIAVPVTVVSAVGAASRFGVVITSGVALEQLGTVRTVALDKTGTLTRNEPQVVEVHTVAGRDTGEVLASAAALERTSTHPLAAAVIRAAGPADIGENVGKNIGENIVEDAGHGLTGDVGGAEIRVGGRRWLDPGELRDDARSMEDRGMSVVVVTEDGPAVGVIGVRDELRPEAPDMVRMLGQRHIRVVMLSGDNRRTATAIADRAGIAEVRADQLPEDKAAAVEALASAGPVAMVGDGINDAPALAAATVGIAIGAGGSAAAVETADVVFTGDDLRLIPGVLAHAARGRRIMTGNIALALAVIVILFPLAVTGVFGLAAVVLIHEIAEVVIIGNGLRAARVDLHPAVSRS